MTRFQVAHSVGHKGVVGRHRTVVIQAKSFPGKRFQTLRKLTIGCVTGRYKKLAIGTKPQPTPGMELRSGNVFNDYFAIVNTVR